MATKTKTKKTPAEVRYGFNQGGFKGVNAQVVGEELRNLEIKPGDFHRTKDVLDAARDPDSELHKCFPWDDEEAAEAHRLGIARKLLRSICYVTVREEKIVKRPLYYHVRDAEGPRYVNADLVASDEEIRQSAIDEALIMLSGFRKRFEYLVELKPLFAAIDELATKKGQKKGKKK